MKAVRYQMPKQVSVDEVDDPVIEDDRDIVLRVTMSGVCGSDLHIFNGLVPQLRRMTLGHEFVGVVEEKGPRIEALEVGDRVIVPFPLADGTCWYCRHGLPTACENSNPRYGPEGKVLSEKGGGIFGYTDLYGGKNGGQAQKVRVPYADYGPRKVPEGLRDEQVVLLTDVLPTAQQACQWGEIHEGDSVAVFGCGPIGLSAIRLAKQYHGAGEVFAVDLVDDRLEVARRMGAVPLHAYRDDVPDEVRERTDGRGADVCIDAVGMEADRTLFDKVSNLVHLQMGSIKALKECFSTVRRGGRVSVVGVYGIPYDNFPLGQMFDKGLRVRMGQANVHEVIDDLLEEVRTGRLRADDLITHTFPLERAREAYDLFRKKEDGCIKVVLKP